MYKYLYNLITAVVVSLMALSWMGSAHAASPQQKSFEQMSASEQAVVLKYLQAQEDATATATAVDAPQKVDEWITLGERMGRMMGGAAKEVGIAVNDFVKTPVGIMTAGLILWKYAGAAAIHIIGGVMIIIFGELVLWWYIRRRITVVHKYHPEKTDIFGRARLDEVTRSKLTDDDMAIAMFGSVVTFAVGIATIFSW